MTTDFRIKRIFRVGHDSGFRGLSGHIRLILPSVVIFPSLPKIRYNQTECSLSQAKRLLKNATAMNAT